MKLQVAFGSDACVFLFGDAWCFFPDFRCGRLTQEVHQHVQACLCINMCRHVFTSYSCKHPECIDLAPRISRGTIYKHATKNHSNKMNSREIHTTKKCIEKKHMGFQYPNLCGLPCPCEVWWLGRWVWHLQSGNRWFLGGLAFRPFVFFGKGGWLKLRVLPWRWRWKRWKVCFVCFFFGGVGVGGGKGNGEKKCKRRLGGLC